VSAALAERVRSLGLTLGFDRVGFASAAPGAHNAALREWLGRGFAGEMAYLTRRVEARIDPRRLAPGTRTLIAVALRYDAPSGAETDCRIAAYAGGEDYHAVLRERLGAFEAGIQALAGPGVALRSYVDTGPVLERAAAAGAGLGWIGKNTCLIDPELGSQVFLGVILTDLALPADDAEPDHCGSCRACLDACPTEAFPEPYVLDASRCLSYTTIELRGPIPDALRAAQGRWVFGCDVCQDVCPWNGRAERRPPRSAPEAEAQRARLARREPWRRATLAWLLDLTEATWSDAVAGTAIARARYRALLRNALVAAGNSGDRALRPACERHAQSDDPELAEHARWAVARLGD
jgi:epoxyqueuosine reductase